MLDCYGHGDFLYRFGIIFTRFGEQNPTMDLFYRQENPIGLHLQRIGFSLHILDLLYMSK